MTRLASWLCLAVLLLPGRPASASPCADTVRTTLGAFAGHWRVQAFFRTSTGAWDTTRAESSIAPDLGGCVMREDYRGTRYGEPYSYLALWGANGWPEARIQRCFVHAGHGILGVSAGSFTGDTLVLEQRFTLRGIPVIEQSLFSRPTARGFTQRSRRSNDGGTTWIETQGATFRPAPAPARLRTP